VARQLPQQVVRQQKRDGALRVGTASAFFAVGTVIALTIILPLYAQLALGLSVAESAMAIIALQGAATVSSVGGGRLIARLVHYKRVPLAGLTIALAALVPLAIWPTGLSPAAALGLIALAGFGIGPTFPFTIVVVQNAVPLHQLGIATGTMNFFRALGSTIVVTGFGALVLAGAPVRGASAEALASVNAAAFGYVFAAAMLCFAIAAACILALSTAATAAVGSAPRSKPCPAPRPSPSFSPVPHATTMNARPGSRNAPVLRCDQ
jgi:MFS family permease